MNTAQCEHVGSSMNAGRLIFNTGGYTLSSTSAQILTLGSNGILVNSSAGASGTTIGNSRSRLPWA